MPSVLSRQDCHSRLLRFLTNNAPSVQEDVKDSSVFDIRHEVEFRHLSLGNRESMLGRSAYVQRELGWSVVIAAMNCFTRIWRFP